MHEVITIGSAFRDVYVFSKKFKVLKDTRAATGEVETFTFGTKIELDDILFEIGGGATNAAYTFRRQGLRTGCVSRIGSDSAGGEVKKFLKEKGITDLSVVDRQQRTAHSVVFLGRGGERTILVYRGAAHHFRTQDIRLSRIKKTKWLYITSLAGNLSLLDKITLFAKKNKIKVALNPGKLEIKAPRSKLNKILGRVDLLLLNREEAAMVGRRAYSDDRGLISDIRKICPGIIIITAGTKGCLLSLKNLKYRVIIKPVKAVDTTGAGDAFGSGFLAGYLRFKGDPLRALRLACDNSAAVVRKIGAKHGLLRKGDQAGRVSLKITKIN